MLLDRLQYELQLMGKRVILTPILIMLGFALLTELLHFMHTDVVVISRLLAASLEMMLPLAAGVIAATITSQDPAIELQLTMPKKYHITAFQRLAIIVSWTTCIAFLSICMIYALGLPRIPLQLQSWSAPLQFIADQFTWIAPLLWFVALGLCLAMLIRSRSASSALLGGIWLLETIAGALFASTTWLQPVFLFPTTLAPTIDFWLISRFEVIGTALLFLLIGWLLLHNPEGLLKGASEE